jgi:hypothetical protein
MHRRWRGGGIPGLHHLDVENDSLPRHLGLPTMAVTVMVCSGIADVRVTKACWRIAHVRVTKAASFGKAK